MPTIAPIEVIKGKPLPSRGGGIAAGRSWRGRVFEALRRLAVGECFAVPSEMKAATFRDYVTQYAQAHPTGTDAATGLATLPQFTTMPDETGALHCWRVA